MSATLPDPLASKLLATMRIGGRSRGRGRRGGTSARGRDLIGIKQEQSQKTEGKEAQEESTRTIRGGGGGGRGGRGKGRGASSITTPTKKRKHEEKDDGKDERKRAPARSRKSNSSEPVNVHPIAIKFLPENLPLANTEMKSMDEMIPAKLLFQASKGFKLKPAMDIEMCPGKPLITRCKLQSDTNMYFETYIAPCMEIPPNCIGRIHNPFQPPFDYERDRKMSD